MDSGDKASNKAMSVAHKYAFLQVFCIPTKDDKDPEVDTPQVQPKQENRDLTRELKQKAFDKSIPAQLEWLEKQLEAAKPELPRDKFVAISERFHGRYKLELPKIIREITGIDPRWEV